MDTLNNDFTMEPAVPAPDMTAMLQDNEETQMPPKVEEEPKKAARPPLPDPVFDFQGGISAFGFSQQGQSHIKKDVPCQDRSSLRFIGKNILLCADADGVGSCKHSDYGAATAVEASLSLLETRLNDALEDPDFKLDAPFMGKLLREVMQYAYDQVDLKAEQLGVSKQQVHSTLTVSVYDGQTLYFAHAGDDGIVALTMDGHCEMVTSRHKGEEASSVYPLQSRHTWQYGMVQNVVAFVLATDGVLDAFVRNEYEGNRVYYPFLEPHFTKPLADQEATAAACRDCYSYMQSQFYRERVTDDLSFICVTNQNTLPLAKKFDFDIEEWNRQSQEFAERKRAALYPSRHPQTQLKDTPVAKTPTPSTPVPARPENNRPTRQQPKATLDDRQRKAMMALDYGRKTLRGVHDTLGGVGGLLFLCGEAMFDLSEDLLQAMLRHSVSAQDHRPTSGNNGGGEKQ